MRRRVGGVLVALWIYVVPLVAPWALLAAVNVSSPAIPLVRASRPNEPFRPDRCTWSCHNHGCRHRPVLPAVLTGDRQLFGGTIRGLSALGTLVSRDRSVGYGAANLAVFCLAWPALMYALWVVAWRQRVELRRLRAEDFAEMYRFGTALYAACVDFMLRVAQLLGVTYRDANAGVFFVLWPAVTATLLLVVLWQRSALARLRRAKRTA